MSRKYVTFEEVCSKCCRGCNSHEKDRCRDVWNASEKATEKRVLDEVIEIFNDGCMPCYGMARNYKAIDTIEFLKELKQKYGVSDE